MTLDVQQARQRFFVMLALDLVLMLVAAGFAVAHFAWGVEWALWAFFGFIAAAFAVQIWFVRGVGRLGKGE